MIHFTWEPRSEPLVNIRFNLDLAWQKGVISTPQETGSSAVHRLSTFPKGAYERMMEKAEGLVPEKELQSFRAFLIAEQRDFKMEDGIEGTAAGEGDRRCWLRSGRLPVFEIFWERRWRSSWFRGQKSLIC